MAHDNYSRAIAAKIESFLTRDEWKFGFSEDIGAFMMHVGLDNCLNDVVVHVHVSETNYLVFAVCPLRANLKSERSKMRILECLTRINFGLRYGCFELSMKTGAIHFRTFVDVEDGVITDDIVRNSILTPVMMFDRYGDAIGIAIYGEEDIKTCVDRIEKSPFPENDDEEDLPALDDEELSRFVENFTSNMATLKLECDYPDEDEKKPDKRKASKRKDSKRKSTRKKSSGREADDFDAHENMNAADDMYGEGV